jgi:hypothetical protein
LKASPKKAAGTANSTKHYLTYGIYDSALKTNDFEETKKLNWRVN